VTLKPIQFLVLLGMVLSSRALMAQQDEPHSPEHLHHAGQPASASWSWTADGNAFFGWNKQQRKYADFSAWESQNWLMLAGDRRAGAGTLSIQGMLSLEPFTMHDIGSPQLFQTGESFEQTPLVNYQHPHDLIMALGGTYRIARPRLTYLFGAWLVGSPALGPTAFMHRDSARDNPQAPLSHHSLDSTHITPGVLTFGVARGPLTMEASAFRGEEPDENRLNIEQPRLNSWSTRLAWRRGPWDAQVSGGRLHDPEWFEPYMTTRLTASVGFNGSIASRPLAATVAWGQNRENNGYNNVDDSYLLEWDYRAASSLAVYGRAELATKQILGLGFHPAGYTHPHYYSRVKPLTFGAVKDFPIVKGQRTGAGADVTFYWASPEMTALYGGSHSFHVFIRWRPDKSTAHVH
jgi:hypothetical protein